MDAVRGVALALVLLASTGDAQDAAEKPPAAEAESQPETWEVSANVLYSDPPGSEDRLTPIFYADRGPLHLEARYNYEDLETTSFFAGWSFPFVSPGEGEVEASFTPMLGAVAGDTDGIAPGLEFDVGWRRVAWYAESEYLFDLDDSDDNFYYSWSTLTYGFTEWLDAGLVIERSKLVDTDFGVQRGLALEITRGALGFSLYAYNLGSDDSYAVVALEYAP
jgi:hypothetical protein